MERHFYVDNGLTLLPSDGEAIAVLKRAQETLPASNLKLHKIASNSINVMEAFPKEDLAKGLKDLDLGADFTPMQRSLGISWDIATDELTFQVSATEKPDTHREVLLTINSLYDIIHSLQYKAFPEVFACIRAGKEIPKKSQLRRLSPYLDDAGCFICPKLILKVMKETHSLSLANTI